MEKKIELVVIFWHDASMIGSEQLTRAEALKQKLMEGWAAGIFVKETKKSITLAMDWFTDGSYRQVHVYPKSGIELIIKKVVKTKK